MRASIMVNSAVGPVSGEVSAVLRVRNLLEPGERILWAGQPRPFRIARTKAAHALFATVILIMLTMTPVRGLLTSSVPAPGPEQTVSRMLIVCSVLLFACYGLLVPLAVYRRAGQTWYVVSDRRILRLYRGRLEASTCLEEVGAAYLRTVDDGTGDILFFPMFAHGNDHPSQQLRGMYGIPEAEEAQRTINEAMDVLKRNKESSVPDYIELLLRAKRPEAYGNRSVH